MTLGVGPVPAPGVEALFAGYVSHDRGEDTFLVLRGRDHAGYQEDNTERHPLETKINLG
jgi:hypothetical protein